MRKFFVAIPIIILALLGGVFFRSLHAPSDPFASVLIDKEVPTFNLPAIPPLSADTNNIPSNSKNNFTPPEGFASTDLVGDVNLVNFFASWCVSCRYEHPLLMSLADQKVIPIMGINWKDKPGDGAAWLSRNGSPYNRIGDDDKGKTAIDFGVTGAPETFVIDKKGRVRYKHAGPISQKDWQTVFQPLIQKLRAE